MFDKRVSGLFLWELLRLAVLELYQDGSQRLFRNALDGELQQAQFDRYKLMQSWSVESSILSMAQSDTSDHVLSLRKNMRETFEIPEEKITVEGVQVVKAIAFAIVKRAARLFGMAIQSVMLQSQLLGSAEAALEEAKRWTSRWTAVLWDTIQASKHTLERQSESWTALTSRENRGSSSVTRRTGLL